MTIETFREWTNVCWEKQNPLFLSILYAMGENTKWNLCLWHLVKFVKFIVNTVVKLCQEKFLCNTQLVTVRGVIFLPGSYFQTGKYSLPSQTPPPNLSWGWLSSLRFSLINSLYPTCYLNWLKLFFFNLYFSAIQ